MASIEEQKRWLSKWDLPIAREIENTIKLAESLDLRKNLLPDEVNIVSISPVMFDFISEFVEAIDEGLIVIDDTDAGVWTSNGYRFYRLGKQILDKVNNGVVKESV